VRPVVDRVTIQVHKAMKSRRFNVHLRHRVSLLGTRIECEHSGKHRTRERAVQAAQASFRRRHPGVRPVVVPEASRKSVYVPEDE
jgi:hypothetical protein